MSNKTFTREISYSETIPIFKGDQDPEFSQQLVKKTVQFLELDQCSRDQHELHFMIMGYCTEGMAKPKGKKKVLIDPIFTKECAEAFLTDMVIIDKDFTDKDRELALNDSGCLIALGLWLIPEKVLPFFLQLTKNMAG